MCRVCFVIVHHLHWTFDRFPYQAMVQRPLEALALNYCYLRLNAHHHHPKENRNGKSNLISVCAASAYSTFAGEQGVQRSNRMIAKESIEHVEKWTLPAELCSVCFYSFSADFSAIIWFGPVCQCIKVFTYLSPPSAHRTPSARPHAIMIAAWQTNRFDMCVETDAGIIVRCHFYDGNVIAVRPIPPEFRVHYNLFDAKSSLKHVKLF